MVEVNAGWMAWTMSTLDEYYLAHRDIGWTKPILAELPSHYLRRQVHATFQDDPVAIHNIPFTGTDCLLWGNDYPAPREHVPRTRTRCSTRLLVDVDDDDARAVVFDNARALFGFSQSVREPVAGAGADEPERHATESCATSQSSDRSARRGRVRRSARRC